MYFYQLKAEQLARLLPIAEFAYNNNKNASTSHMSFKLNYGYHPHIFFEDEVKPYSRYRSANKPAKKLRELISICHQNLLHIQEPQKASS